MPHMDLIARFIAICLFRAGPEDVPASLRTLQLTLAAYLLMGIVVNVLEANLFTALAVTVADILVLFAFVLLLLNGYRKRPRFQQTVTAVMGTSTVLSLLVLPFLAMFYQYDDTTQAAGWLLFTLMLMMLWSLMVTAHIFRRAIACSAPISVAWTLLYVVISVICNGLVMSAVA